MGNLASSFLFCVHCFFVLYRMLFMEQRNINMIALNCSWTIYFILIIGIIIIFTNATTSEVNVIQLYDWAIKDRWMIHFLLQGKLTADLVHDLMHQTRDDRIISKVIDYYICWLLIFILYKFSWCKCRSSNSIVFLPSVVACSHSIIHCCSRWDVLSFHNTWTGM